METQEKAQWEKLVRAMARLIKARSPSIAQDKLNREAMMLSLKLRNKFQTFQSLKKLPEENSKDQLKRISKLATDLSEELENLALSTTIDLTISGDMDLGDLDRIRGVINDLDYAIAQALKNRTQAKKKGRPKDFSKEACIETAIQIYEGACGQSFDKILKMKMDNRRRHMTALYSLMEPAITEWRHFQDFPSLKKFTLRYIQDGRTEREDVADELKQESF